MAIADPTVGTARVLSATANVKPTNGAMLGVLCTASTAGTLILYDSATTTTTAPLTGTLSLVAGTWYPIPVAYATGLYAVLGGTATITVVFV